MKFIYIVCFLLFIPSCMQAGNTRSKAGVDSLAGEIDRIAFSHGGMARTLMADFYQITQKHPEDFALSVQYIYREAALSYAQGVHDSTLTIKINKYLTEIDKEKFPLEYALLNYSLALNFTTKGSYIDAFSTSLQTLELFQKLQNKLFIAKTYNALGNICSYMKIGNMAEDYYRQGQKFVNPNHAEYYHLQNNLFRLLFFEQHSNTALDSLLHFIPKVQAFKDTAILSTTYLNIGACYSTNGDYKQALHYYILSENLLKSIDNRKLTLTLHQSMGIYYYMIGDYKKALNHFIIAKDIATKDGNLSQLSSSLSNLSSTFAVLGDTTSAYIYLDEYQTLSRKLMSNTQAIKAYQAYVSAFMDASKNKLIVAEQRIQLENRYFIVVIIISISLILMILLLLFVVQQQKRIKTAENKKLNIQLEKEKEIQQLHDEKHAEAIESKIREITSYSLQLSNKNEILKQILDLTQQLPENKKDIGEIRKKISHVVTSNLNTDNDWENFKLHFDKVHPRFFEKLKAACEGLTETNLRICAYFRIGMSNKQIAQILNISPESIIIHRYRLKKKLGLAEDENLDNFIRNI